MTEDGKFKKQGKSLQSRADVDPAERFFIDLSHVFYDTVKVQRCYLFA